MVVHARVEVDVVVEPPLAHAAEGPKEVPKPEPEPSIEWLWTSRTHAEFEREVQRRHPLREPAQDHHESGAGLARTGQRSIRKGVEDALARSAAKLDDRRRVWGR